MKTVVGNFFMKDEEGFQRVAQVLEGLGYEVARNLGVTQGDIIVEEDEEK